MEHNILFRCSRLGDLVSGSEGLTNIQSARLLELKSKQEAGKITDKQIIELGSLLEKQGNIKSIGKGTESYVKSVWLEREYGYREEFCTEEILKGQLCEQNSMELVKDVLGGEFRAKNQNYFKNDFIHGTPDIILKKQDYVEDVKTSFNLRTFTEADLNKLYWWQGQGYMWLTGKKRYRLIYSLVKTPEELISNEKRRWFYKFGQDEYNPHFMAACEQIDKNNDLIDQLPKACRLKIFEFDFDPEKIELLKVKIESCRDFYKSLSLPINLPNT